MLKLDEALLLKSLEEVFDFPSVLPDLAGEKTYAKWKRVEPRAVCMGHKPAGQSLFAGMKLAATGRDDGMPQQKQTVAYQGFSQEVKIVHVLFEHGSR